MWWEGSLSGTAQTAGGFEAVEQGNLSPGFIGQVSYEGPDSGAAFRKIDWKQDVTETRHVGPAPFWQVPRRVSTRPVAYCLVIRIERQL